MTPKIFHSLTPVELTIVVVCKTQIQEKALKINLIDITLCDIINTYITLFIFHIANEKIYYYSYSPRSHFNSAFNLLQFFQ